MSHFLAISWANYLNSETFFIYFKKENEEVSESLKLIFDRVDSDHDGLINSSEFHALLTAESSDSIPMSQVELVVNIVVSLSLSK